MPMNLVIPEKPAVGVHATVSDIQQIHGMAEARQAAVPQIRDPFLRRKLASLRSFLQFQPSDFEVLCLLGVGDVGRVYLVKRSSPDVLIPTGRDEVVFALKVCGQHDLRRRSKTHRFLEERDILIASHHPYIMTLHATFADERNFYLLMEFCNGGEFAELLRRQPGHCLPEHIVRFYAAELVSALEYLHFYGVIYRDLKTENVLLHSDGHIRLTDFDLAKRVDMAKVVTNFAFTSMEDSGSGQKSHSRHSRGGGEPTVFSTQFDAPTNSLVGTPECLPPEVIKGEHSQAADWWTLGIFIFECLYGRTPFFSRGASFDVIKKRITRGLFTFPETPKVSRHAKALIKSLLETDPQKRLGAKYGAAEIKSHPWFHGLNFAFLGEPPELPHYTLRDPIGRRREQASRPIASAPSEKRRRKSSDAASPPGEERPATFNAQYYSLTPEDLAAIRKNFNKYSNEAEMIARDLAGTGFRLPPAAQKYVPRAIQAYLKARLPAYPKSIDIYGEEIARLTKGGYLEPSKKPSSDDSYEGVQPGHIIKKGAITIQQGDADAIRLQDEALLAVYGRRSGEKSATRPGGQPGSRLRSAGPGEANDTGDSSVEAASKRAPNPSGLPEIPVRRPAEAE